MLFKGRLRLFRMFEKGIITMWSHGTWHKHAKVGKLVILAQKVKVGEKYNLHFWILRFLAMPQIFKCTCYTK
jgi:hypothetical protein